MQSIKKIYGEFNQENDGRLSGHVMTIKNMRRDGKFSVTHAFGGGKCINKIYSLNQLLAEINKFDVVVSE
jgi:hypothetical protein